MNEISERLMITGFVDTAGRGFDFPPADFYATHSAPSEGRIRLLNRSGTTTIRPGHEEWDEAWRNWQRLNQPIRLRVEDQKLLARTRRQAEIELGRYIGKRGGKHAIWLLNGNGFDQQGLTAIQTLLRQHIEANVAIRGAHRHRLIVPYQALQAAQLDFDTIRAVHITRDGRVSTPREVPKPPPDILRANMPTCANSGSAANDTQRAFTHEGHRYQIHRWNLAHPAIYTIMHQAEFSPRAAPHQIREVDDKWMVTESVHRLGASVFSAVGPDGKRHRWVSAFDQNENPAMYFLAQLPDKGAVRYYGHAVKLLAPPVVHKAREQGKRVFRQGDIFAIETSLTDADLAKLGAKITCRDEIFMIPVTDVIEVTTESATTNVATMATTGGAGVFMTATGTSATTGLLHQPVALTAQGNVLSDDGRRDWRKRRRLQIYGTSHTATWVAVKPDNTTFVKGVMFHDPILENIRANREPEHRPVPLLADRWFLCCRNTVPRQPVITQDNVTGGINA